MVCMLDDVLYGLSVLFIIVKFDGMFEMFMYLFDIMEGYVLEFIDVDWLGDWEMFDVLEEYEWVVLDEIGNGWEVLIGWVGVGMLFIFDVNY